MNGKKRISDILIVATLLISAVLLFGLIFKTSDRGKPVKTEPATKAEKVPEVVVEDHYNEQFNSISIFARKDEEMVADYYYTREFYVFMGVYYIDFHYVNSNGRIVSLRLNEADVVQSVSVSGKEYKCSDSENVNLCEKAAEKVAYWKSIMKWDERVKRILEELKNRKPEEELE